jgi:hypothetical protein
VTERVDVAAPSRPVRARTRAGRLAALDAWVCHERAEVLQPGGVVLDVGFGAEPVTTLELAAAVRRCQPALRVVGVERDAARVGRADGVALVQGDFASLAALGPACLVRAMNVLRGYRDDEVPAIHAALGAATADGGLVLEGSADSEGQVTAAWVFAKQGGALVREALLLHTDFSRGFSPWLFRDWLPRDLRRRVRPGAPVHGLLSAWAGVVAAQGAGRTPRVRWVESLDAMRAHGLEATAWERAHGYARWNARA